MKELLKSFFAYGLTSGLSKFVSLLLLPIYTRYFSPSDYGIIDIIQSIIYIIMIFGSIQLETSLQRYYYEVEHEQRKREGSVIFIFVSCVSFILALLIAVFSSAISNIIFSTEIYSFEIMVAAIIIPLTNMSIISFIIIRYMKRPILFGIITISQVLFTALFTILFVVYFKLGILGVFYAQVIGFVIVNIIQLFYLRSFYILCWDNKILKKMLKFALPQFPARLVSTSNAYINRFFMIAFLSATSIGVYSVALKFASVMQLFLSAFIMAWWPFMYEEIKKKNHKIRFQKIFKYVCVLLVLLIFMISLFAKEVVQLFTTPEYYNASSLVGGLSLYYALFFIKEMVDLGPRIENKTIYITYTYLISAVVNICLLYVCVYLFDLVGVVISLVLTNIIIVGFSWFFSSRLYPVAYSKRFFFISFLIMILLVCINSVIVIEFEYKIIIVLFIFSSLCFLFFKFKQKKKIDIFNI